MSVKTIHYISIILAILCCLPLFSQKRIETEYKLSIPASKLDTVWKYLKDKYSDNKLFLKSSDSGFYVLISDEYFKDIYFDNNQLQLLSGKNGIRYRTRKVLSDSNNRKNNRELIQIKISSANGDDLTREEYKYHVAHYNTQESAEDGHSFLGLIKRKDRSEVIEKLKLLNIDAYSLKPTVLVNQNRKRICINKGEATIYGISLDEVTAEYNDQHSNFIEVEIEVNEIEFTNADLAGRRQMEKIIGEIKSQILQDFPEIKLDQLPKYNKSYDRLMLKK